MNDFILGLKFFWDKGKRFVFSFIILGIIFAFLIIALIVFALSGIFGVGSGGIAKSSFGAPSRAVDVAYSESDYSSQGAYSKEISSIIPPFPQNPPASTGEEPTERKVIRNGSLEMIVKNAEDTASAINTLADSLGGFVQNVNIYEVSEGVKSGNLSMRVPADKFTEAMDGIKKMAVKVEREGVNSDDVTTQYVDLEAQVKNYRAEERQYQEIMSRAVKIEDVLNVAQRLSDVRGRIERAQGQLNYLSRQVSMSTISVSLTAEPEVRVFGIVWRPLTVLKQSFKSFLTDLTGFVDWLVKFIFKIPIYLLRIAIAVLIVWIVWRIILWAKRRIWRR